MVVGFLIWVYGWVGVVGVRIVWGASCAGEEWGLVEVSDYAVGVLEDWGEPV